jgi:hypothetical protein
MDDTSQLILTELREMRSDMSNWRTESESRLSVLESQVKSGIVGNGQPSRLAVVESEVADLKQNWKYTLGAGFGGGTVVAVVAWLLEFVVKR